MPIRHSRESGNQKRATDFRGLSRRKRLIGQFLPGVDPGITRGVTITQGFTRFSLS